MALLGFFCRLVNAYSLRIVTVAKRLGPIVAIQQLQKNYSIRFIDGAYMKKTMLVAVSLALVSLSAEAKRPKARELHVNECTFTVENGQGAHGNLEGTITEIV